MKKILTLICFSLLLSNCNTLNRLKNVGSPPPLDPMTTQASVDEQMQPIPYPLPAPDPPQKYAANSLWRKNADGFFKDQRASRVGDILTIDVNIKDDKATFENGTESKREKAEEKANLNNLFNSETINSLLANFRNPAGIVANFDSSNAYKGSGKIERKETLKVNIAGIVTRVLPNGNFIIHGRQQIRVNHEMRDLMVSGVIRPEDITPENTISYEKIAEIRLSYGGEGQLSNIQQPRYGQQIFDLLFPF